MFKVPSDPANPSYDKATKVTFWQWLTSSKTDRNEWRRRRDAAIPTSRVVRRADDVRRHADARVNEARRERQDIKAARRRAKQVRKGR